MQRFFKYLDTIAQANKLGQVEWLFYPGMLQESQAKWWDDFGLRKAFHEGVDICFYRNSSESMLSFSPQTKIPAMDNGLVLNICDDFLGKTLVVEHKNFKSAATRVVFAYSHLNIDPFLEPGSLVEKGQILATVFDTSLRKSRLLSHLHFSCIEVLQNTPPDKLNWNLFPFREKVKLINPLFI